MQALAKTAPGPEQIIAAIVTYLGLTYDDTRGAGPASANRQSEPREEILPIEARKHCPDCRPVAGRYRVQAPSVRFDCPHTIKLISTRAIRIGWPITALIGSGCAFSSKSSGRGYRQRQAFGIKGLAQINSETHVLKARAPAPTKIQLIMSCGHKEGEKVRPGVQLAHQ